MLIYIASETLVSPMKESNASLQMYCLSKSILEN